MSERNVRPSLVELILQCVRESVDTPPPGWEDELGKRLSAALHGPFTDGQIITAAYLNLVESRLAALEQQLFELRKQLQPPSAPSNHDGFIVGE